MNEVEYTLPDGKRFRVTFDGDGWPVHPLAMYVLDFLTQRGAVITGNIIRGAR